MDDYLEELLASNEEEKILVIEVDEDCTQSDDAIEI